MPVTAKRIDAIKTYRYLRLAMLALVALFSIAIIIERLGTEPGCWQTSISGYYYTPAQAVIVASFIAVGICMIVLKGSTEVEDILLNSAGILAPVVAVVPTPNPGDCRSVAITVGDLSPNVMNNIIALLITGAISLVVTAIIAARAQSQGDAHAWDHRIGISVSVAIVSIVALWFFADGSSFLKYAHYTAAVALFACMIAVVWANARGLARHSEQSRSTGRERNGYIAIAVAMVIVMVGGFGWLPGWKLTLLWVEALLIFLFAVFWILQTIELWDEGLRD